MTTEWRAIVTWPRPDDIDHGQLTVIAETLPGYGILGTTDRHLRVEMTVEGATLRQATDAALQVTRAARRAGGLGQPTQLRVLPVDDHEAEMARPPAQELIGYTEAAEILGVSPQRAGQLAQERADFPAPVATPAMGPIFTRASIEAFAKLPRRGGRPRKDAAA